MADTVHDDQLAEAFARFRSEAREEIQLPGTHTVRHAARRRRTIQVACAAAAVVLIGATAVVMTTVDSPDRTPSAYPTLSAAQMEGLATLAGRALPRGDGMSAAVTARTQGEPYTISPGGSPLRYEQGLNYDLVALCLGRGTVIVAWEAPGGVTGSAAVLCGGDLVRVRFIPRADGLSVQIRLTPDAEAIGRAGIAVNILDL